MGGLEKKKVNGAGAGEGWCWEEGEWEGGGSEGARGLHLSGVALRAFRNGWDQRDERQL